MQTEKITMENEHEFLAMQYPMIGLTERKSLVRYDPEKHEMEKGDPVFYLDIDQGIVRKGIVEAVMHSKPWNHPTYVIEDAIHMKHRVWPNVEGQKILEKHNVSYTDFLKKTLSPEEFEVLV